MSRPALATPSDVEVRLGQTITNTDQCQARLADASELVRAFAGVTWLNEDEDDVEDVPAAVVGVVAQMVERAARNPDGAVDKTAGPFRLSFGADAALRIYLTDNDRAVITAALGSDAAVFGGIGTISTTRGPLETPPVRVDGMGRLPDDADIAVPGDV